jgi:hypothetical protein
MVVALGLLVLALRAGLRIRRARHARLAGARPRAGKLSASDLLRAHLRIAKPAIVVVLIGFVAGPASSFWLRGWDPFEKLHSWLGLAAAGLFVATALLGRRLEQRRRGARAGLHGLLGLLGVLAAALTAMAGMVLLP